MFVLKLLLLILVLWYFTIMWKVVPDMMEDDIIGAQPTHVKVIYAIITPVCTGLHVYYGVRTSWLFSS